MIPLRLVGLTLIALATLPQPLPTLAVHGVSGPGVTLSLSDLALLPQQKVGATDHGTHAVFEGVLLSDVLAKVESPAAEKYHSAAASYYLLVEAQDGYKAVYAWAELDPSFRDNAVYVVWKRDGKPLGEKEGPFRLIAPADQRAARWVRQVTGLWIRQGSR